VGVHSVIGECAVGVGNLGRAWGGGGVGTLGGVGGGNSARALHGRGATALAAGPPCVPRLRLRLPHAASQHLLRLLRGPHSCFFPAVVLHWIHNFHSKPRGPTRWVRAAAGPE
jgi:hypothetical protein